MNTYTSIWDARVGGNLLKAYSGPIYVSLHTEDPREGRELAGGHYVRQKISFAPGKINFSVGGKSNMVTLPAVGSRVRYTVEGVVQRVDDRWGRKVVVVKNGKGVSTDIDVTNPGLDAEVLSRPFIPGKRYRTTPNGQFEGVRTSFGKWLVTKHHIDPSMVGEVLTDEKFIALRNEDPAKRRRILDTMELVD